MILNPELRRNLWLEMSLQKLLLTPLLITAILCLCYLSKYSVSEMAYNISIFYLFFWGTKSAAESIPNELIHRTWDYQRLSTLSPWTLSWGKLLGSPIYAWYGALIGLLFYMALSLQSSSVYLVITKVGILLLGGLLAHSIALLMSLQSLDIQKEGKISTSLYWLSGLWVGYFFTSHSLTSLPKYHILNFPIYNMLVSQFTFYFGSLCIFLFWSLIGIYRNMRQALQYRSGPGIWLLFNLFSVFYIPILFRLDFSQLRIPSVVFNGEHTLSLLRYTFFATANVLTYVALFSEKFNIITYKKLFNKTNKLNYLPRWVISFLITFLIGIGLILLPTYPAFPRGVLEISCILFLIRDILIVHYFKFMDTSRPKEATSLIYLGVLYCIIPPLLILLKLDNQWLSFFIPMPIPHKGLFALAPLLECLTVAWLIKKQWDLQAIK